MSAAEPTPLLSVITVCFNAMPVLPVTAASLRAQAGGGVEWVVVDGASTDGSTGWLQAQGAERFVSEPDRGIYDAMNKAVALARGEWLFFLNAGDAFADPLVLRDIVPVLRGTKAGVVYGDVLYVGAGRARRKRFHWVTRRRLLYGDLCHQAAFVRRALFERHGRFDDTLRYNADFDWFLRVFHGGDGLLYVHRDIARFDDGGAHVQAGQHHVDERHRVHDRYLPRWGWKLGNFALRVELKLRRWAGQEIG